MQDEGADLIENHIVGHSKSFHSIGVTSGSCLSLETKDATKWTEHCGGYLVRRLLTRLQDEITKTIPAQNL